MKSEKKIYTEEEYKKLKPEGDFRTIFAIRNHKEASKNNLPIHRYFFIEGNNILSTNCKEKEDCNVANIKNLLDDYKLVFQTLVKQDGIAEIRCRPKETSYAIHSLLDLKQIRDALPPEKLNEFDNLYGSKESNPEFWNLDDEKATRLASGMLKEITENLIEDENNWAFASVRSVDFLLKIKNLIKLVDEEKYKALSIGLCDFFIMYHNFGYTECSNELIEKRVKAKPVIAKEKNVEKRKENRHKLYKEFKEKGYTSMKIYREIVKTESPELKTRDKTFKPKVNAMKTWFSENPFSNG